MKIKKLNPLIRRARTKDLPRIREIYNGAIRERIATADEPQKSLPDRWRWYKQFGPRYPIFVLLFEGVVVGYGCLFRYSSKSGYRFAVENSVYIDSPWRGRGFGKMMLRHLIKAARRCGHKYVEARIFSHNPSSLHLHRVHGFELVGVQKRIANLDGRWFDVVILSLHI